MNALPSRSLALALVGGAMMSLAACGGGAPDAKAPASHEAVEPEPTSVEEAQDQISRARDRLAGVAPGAPPGPGSADTSRPSLAEPAPPPPMEPPSPESSPRFPSSRPSPGKAGSASEANRCASPCRALASMRRAVTALCRMTGDTDNRCLDAKRTLADSEGRISPCSC